jgi:hypothetical protein
MTLAVLPSSTRSGGTPPDAVASVSVMALVECLLGGVRRAVGERFEIPSDRVADLTALGFVFPDFLLDQMPPAVAAQWRAAGRRGLTDASLVADDATIDALWHSGGRVLSPDGVPSHYAPARPARRALRVLNLTQYDPGSAAYRYHSAANTVPSVVSAFARWGHANPHCHLRQWDGDLHRRTVELLAMTADVIHVHMDYRALWHDLKYVHAPHQRIAITYHGSVLPGDTRRQFVHTDSDARVNAIRFGARPYHARFGIEHYLPIPMPVADYAALAAERELWAGLRSGRKFRIAHSPTRREIKGSHDFESAVQYLIDHEGLPIEPVMIEGRDHGDALRLKATCDATFDSFWLGMQGSGLEAAAMGQAVIAGDADAAAEAAALNAGAVPWTFAADRPALVSALRALVCDPAHYRAEAERVGRYVALTHDYRAVGARYAHILTEAVRGTADRC